MLTVRLTKTHTQVTQAREGRISGVHGHVTFCVVCLCGEEEVRDKEKKRETHCRGDSASEQR